MVWPPVGRGQVMDLSTGKNIHETREWIIGTRRCRSGTVAIYQALEKVKAIRRNCPGRSTGTP